MAMKFNKMIKMMEHAFTAASFAEEGDSETAHAMMKESRRVLLALKAGQIDPKTLRYAVNTAKRVDAHLDILYVAPSRQRKAGDPLVDSLIAELAEAGISYRIIHRQGCLKQQIIDYTNSEREILFAVIESPASLDEDCAKREKELSELWRQLKCPLVVVMDGAGA